MVVRRQQRERDDMCVAVAGDGLARGIQADQFGDGIGGMEEGRIL